MLTIPGQPAGGAHAAGGGAAAEPLRASHQSAQYKVIQQGAVRGTIRRYFATVASNPRKMPMKRMITGMISSLPIHMSRM